MEVNAVLFDLGGTLHHYHREEVFRTILKEKGIEVRASEVLRAYDVDGPDICSVDCGTSSGGDVARIAP